MFSVAVVLVLIILVILSYLIYRNHTHLNDIPMPPCNFFLGHALDFVDVPSILKTFTNYTIQYGGVLRIYIPPARPTIVITDPEVIQTILTSEDMLSKSKDYNFFKPWLGNGLITSDVKTWKRHRRLLTPCFGRLSLIKNFIDVFDTLGDVLVDKLNRELNNNDFDIFPLIKMYSLDVICETSMGISINTQENSERVCLKSIEQICHVIANRIKTPYKRFDFIYKFTKDYDKLIQAMKSIDSFFYTLMKSERKTGEVQDKQDEKLAFLDLLLKLHDDHKFTQDEVRDEVNTILFGGHDTTATAIAFLLYALARNPKIQEKVVQEQINIFGSLNPNSSTYQDLQDMKYLELVIYEALRMFPTIPIIGRKINTDIQLESGIVLPKNLSICIFIYGCHHNPKYFPEPDKFIPERFQGDIKPYTFIPFSSGPRNCIGKKYAILQMKSCVSKIVRNFKLQPCHPEYTLELIPQLTLFAKNGIRLSIQKR